MSKVAYKASLRRQINDSVNIRVKVFLKIKAKKIIFWERHRKGSQEGIWFRILHLICIKARILRPSENAYNKSWAFWTKVNTVRHTSQETLDLDFTILEISVYFRAPILMNHLAPLLGALNMWNEPCLSSRGWVQASWITIKL